MCKKFHHHVNGPDEDYEIVLHFHQALTKGQIDNLEKLCNRGEWCKKDDVYWKGGGNKDVTWEYGVSVHPKERRIVIWGGSN